MEKNYVSPEMEITLFDTVDVIEDSLTTSGNQETENIPIDSNPNPDSVPLG